MSEANEPAVKTIKRRNLLFIGIGLAGLLLIIYIAGGFFLPDLIKSSYRFKNCETVLNLNNIYTGIYPSALVGKSIDGAVKECALYYLATSSEGQKAWQDSYNAYKAYLSTYPEGLFTDEAYQHSAVVLIAWAKDSETQGDYSQAVTNLKLVLASYGKATAAKEASGLMPDAYLGWSRELCDKSDFSGAENADKEFIDWANQAQDAQVAKSAQTELAQTYFAWGSALQSQKEFQSAKDKYDLAISSEPQPASASGPAAQAQAAQVKLYTEWGDALLEQKDFLGAIDRYQKALSLSKSDDQPAAKDLLANAYLKWADDLSAGEDFRGALNKIGDAGKNAASDAMKKSLDGAQKSVYQAFSKSTGRQAQQAMKDAAKAVCEDKKKPDLPIFGLDTGNVHAVTYGVDDRLPESALAQTPGSMHYVACIELVTKTVEVKTFLWARLVREQYSWNVTLRNADDGQVSASRSFEGGIAPPLPEITRSNYMDILLGSSYQRYRGTNPDIADLANWLLTVMK